ncbi:MAG TPA: polysaccharide biosynthesis protein [Candidatus Limnocylindrales bacterium]|nr:polysaccharide biosynthesis protein [Candidatus Limnocylindrales bacterium]
MGIIRPHIEDLLVEPSSRRDSVPLNWSRFLKREIPPASSLQWNKLVSEKTILITGAGGSIGSSLAVQLMAGLPKTLVLLDRSECNLRSLQRRYLERQVTLPRVEFIQGDILDQRFLDDLFRTYEPEIVFHAAALKHLPPLESDPFAALENNVLGTFNLLRMVDCSRVEYFVNVSTDKAVNPTSVLGVSKRIVELLLLAGYRTDPLRLSVRLGNVLESSGSVVPHFLRCLREGSPLSITDPQASRYFLTMEEAALFLVGSLQFPESCMVLPEMGVPRTVMELVIFLLNEFQIHPCLQSMTFTGLRDGEKRSEQLTHDYERVNQHAGPLRTIIGHGIFCPDRFPDDFAWLLKLVVERRKKGLLDSLLRLVPEFRPSPAFLRCIS